MGAARPLETMAAAADAAVWLMVFSIKPKRRTPNTSMSRHNARPISAAAIDMLKLHPILRPV